MKSNIIFAMIFLFGCNNSSSLTTYKPKFKIGDCVVHVINPNREKWEKNEVIVSKIVDIGNSNYRTVELTSSCTYAYLVHRGINALCYDTDSFKFFDSRNELIAGKCPNLEDLLPSDSNS